MDYPIWIIYTLFVLASDGERYVSQASKFDNRNECLAYTRKYSMELSDAWQIRLDREHGEDGYVALEMGCVPRDKNNKEFADKRVPVIAIPWSMPQKAGELL